MNERTNISLFLYSVISNNLYPFIFIFFCLYFVFSVIKMNHQMDDIDESKMHKQKTESMNHYLRLEN